jgi:hypothetical protein
LKEHRNEIASVYAASLFACLIYSLRPQNVEADVALALTGQVTSAEEGPIEGVLVTSEASRLHNGYDRGSRRKGTIPLFPRTGFQQGTMLGKIDAHPSAA